MPMDRIPSAVAIQFAETPAEVGDDPNAGRSYYPTDEDDEARKKMCADWEKYPQGPRLIKAAEQVERANKGAADSADNFASIAVKHLVPCTIPSFNPRHHQETPLPSDCSVVMSKWINENRSRLRSLHYSDVDPLLDDIAAAIARQMLERQSDSTADNQSLDHRIDRLILSVRNFICFVSRVLKLHWYLGHNGWSDAIKTLDGQFPRTPRPCIAWIETHRDDAAWWKPFHDVVGAGVTEAIAEDRRLHLIALTRAWLFPAVYLAAVQAMRAGSYVIADYYFPYESLSPSTSFRNCLGAFVDPWLHASTDDVRIPVCLTDDDLDGDEEDGLKSIIDMNTASTHNVGSVLDKLLRTCRDRMIESQNWATGFDEAFPQVGSNGSNLRVCDLAQRKRLGFSLREIESEVEGEAAWYRHVLHAVFEDAFGPEALARKLKKRVRSKLFRAIGSGAAAYSFKEKSDYCQNLLREVVIRILQRRHGESWLNQGVDDRTRQKVKHVLGAEDPPDSWLEKRFSGAERIPDFFENTDIIDYLNVLNCDSNWPVTEGLLSKVGCERPEQKTLMCKLRFNDWNKARNASAHPEKHGYDSFSDASETLDEVQRILNVWLILTEAYDNNGSARQ